jgi:glutamate racemase
MNNPKVNLPIGVFDSGIGGISVLADLIKTLPHEKFIYYADTLYSPYGIRPEDTVRSLSIKVAEFLSFIGIKSLVVACNTATSAAIYEIRRMYTFPVIGMEPAVKPAVKLGGKGKILVMATPLTLKSKKFHELMHSYKRFADIIPFPCEKLVEIIEQDHADRRVIEDYLSRVFSSIDKEHISTIVLGCTHYALIKKEILKIVGNNINVIDGNSGTARQVKTVLQKEHLLNNGMSEKLSYPLKANVRFYVSGNKKEVITTCKQLLQNEGIVCSGEFSLSHYS